VPVGNSLRKNSPIGQIWGQFGMAGAEALFISLGLSARLKVVPCYKAPSIEFFRKLRSRALLQSPSIEFFRKLRSRALLQSPSIEFFFASCEVMPSCKAFFGQFFRRL
jgi:hypothetical protein